MYTYMYVVWIEVCLSQVRLFRPRHNLARMNISAARACLPKVHSLSAFFTSLCSLYVMLFCNPDGDVVVIVKLIVM